MPRFCPCQQRFALHHHERTVQRADRGSHPRRAHRAKLAREPFHGAASCRHLQRLFRGLVSERQRDEAVIAGAVKLQLQLRAPEVAVTDQRTLRRTRRGLCERLVQLSQPVQARPQHALVRTVAAIAAIQQRHMPRLAHQQAQPDHPQIAALALGVPTTGELPRGQRGDMRIEVRGVEREHVRAEIEAGNGRLRDRHLRPLQIALGDLLRHAMERLPAERRARQTRQARHARVQNSPKIPGSAPARMRAGSRRRPPVHPPKGQPWRRACRMRDRCGQPDPVARRPRSRPRHRRARACPPYAWRANPPPVEMSLVPAQLGVRRSDLERDPTPIGPRCGSDGR